MLIRDPWTVARSRYRLEMQRRRNAVGMAVGVGALVGSAVLARRPRSQTEIRLFRAANELPAAAFPVIWTVMQYGTFGTVPLAATVALACRRPRLALALAIGGSTSWVSAKAAKRLVVEGRPSSIVEGVLQRGTEEGDLGFPSGHAAVSAAVTVIAWPDASSAWRAAIVGLCGLVPLGRMYVGAHMPLDLVGGSALGLAVGCAVNVAGIR
jgi:membrane-associated phospholipid phosphatase